MLIRKSFFSRFFLFLFAMFYMGSGLNHFRDPDFYVHLMPPYFPLHLELVYLSGVIEIALGAAALVPKFRRLAAWAVMVMLISFMPVHIHMVMHPELYPEVPEIGLWIRLPIQGLLVAWAYVYTRPARGQS